MALDGMGRPFPRRLLLPLMQLVGQLFVMLKIGFVFRTVRVDVANYLTHGPLAGLWLNYSKGF